MQEKPYKPYKINKILSKISSERGFKAENKVNEVLEEMKNNGEIVTFYKTDKRSDKYHGIDFMIITINGDKIPIQVKSSLRNVQAHLKKFPNVPAIVIEQSEYPESIKNKIRSLINNEE
jgi:hypothetical protein